MMKLSRALTTLCWLGLSAAASLRIQIPPSNLLPNPNVLPASTHATLTSSSSPQLKAILRKGNFLEFPEIPAAGSYLLDIYSRDYVFAPYRIDISSSEASTTTTQISGAYETYRGTQWSDHGVPLTPNGRPTDDLTITAKVLSRKSFYEQRQGLNVLNLLKNPMILMGVVALAFTFGMPKLMENMDPEMKAEYEEMQKKGPAGAIGRAMQGGGGGGGSADSFDLAGFLAGSQAKTSSSQPSAGGIRERKR
jgi:ER membrane protein complex subunit 7